MQDNHRFRPRRKSAQSVLPRRMGPEGRAGRPRAQLVGTPQTFTDATGTLTASFTSMLRPAKRTITYSYTLLDNTLADPSNMNFAVVITDRDGDGQPPATSPSRSWTTRRWRELTVILLRPDRQRRTATSSRVRAQLPGQHTPMFRAPTAACRLWWRGRRDHGPCGADRGRCHRGPFGTLTLNADGSYTYAHTAGGGTETFTYTIRDLDGSLAHATLTISLGDAAPGNFNIPVLAAQRHSVRSRPSDTRRRTGGSHTAIRHFPTTTQTGTITFFSLRAASGRRTLHSSVRSRMRSSNCPPMIFFGVRVARRQGRTHQRRHPCRREAGAR